MPRRLLALLPLLPICAGAALIAGFAEPRPAPRPAPPAAPPAAAAPSPTALNLPERPAVSPDGTAFARAVEGLDDGGRYAAGRAQILAGNVPDFLRTLAPVALRGADHEVTLYVTRDYLSVGTDADYLDLPLDFADAARVALALGFALPTTRIVDAVYQAATERLEPVTMPPTKDMRTIGYVLRHRALIDAERTRFVPGDLVAGTKKDTVLTGRLRDAPGREAIYGWHHLDGRPIQPLCLWHGATYADYSHGIRLVADTVLVDGEPRDYFDALADPVLAAILSDEGPIPDARALLEAGAAAR